MSAGFHEYSLSGVNQNCYFSKTLHNYFHLSLDFYHFPLTKKRPLFIYSKNINFTILSLDILDVMQY